ncbi:MAG: DUF1343 domain-containing protein [Acidobacteria bacterium]|nr:DUF1343 domain-containing protein [Acidobacteriota bacterium]
MKNLEACLATDLILACLLTVSSSAAAPEISEVHLAHIEGAIQDAIRDGQCPGAVVVVGHQGKVVYRRAFGRRALVPAPEAMTEDTIFDIASLTKVVATTPAVMQLVEQGRIRMQEPVAKYWPEFKSYGKDTITIGELLTHYSGLRADLDLKPVWSGYDTAMKLILDEKPVAEPGTRFIYSDINFEILGELARRVTGQTLDAYCAANVFEPLGMKDTRFNPPPDLRNRIAPADHRPEGSRELLWGEVHDPTARYMGGVAGHAGLFSTADDLTTFVEMLLNGGTYHGVRILGPLTVEKMTTPQSPPGKQAVRGLGWDIDSPYSSPRGEFFPVGSFGHTGYTGTSIWVEPVSKTFVILLTSRLHPDAKGNVVSLRGRIASIVASALGGSAAAAVLNHRRGLTGGTEQRNTYSQRELRDGAVKTGIDMLVEERLAPLAGLRVGLITNHTGRDREGRRTIDLLHAAPQVSLIAIFSPEHGLVGTSDTRVNSAVDDKTGLPIYSLYGRNKRPTAQMLEGLDGLVFDIQDAGARFYTYITTMGYAMEAAAQKGIKFIVLDRPNPITGYLVEGPMLDRDLISFTGYFSMPVRHGMTVGELAVMFNAEKHLGLKLEVIKMRGWRRTDWFDETGLEWVNPSPNLRNMTEIALYPGVAMIEGANVSVGRGTDTPFALVGAPWIIALQFSGELTKRQIAGVSFMPVRFTPNSGPYAGISCQGVSIILLDRGALNSPALGIELASALYRLYPRDFDLDRTLSLIGSRAALDEIRQGKDASSIILGFDEPLEQFRHMREKFLLYP